MWLGGDTPPRGRDKALLDSAYPTLEHLPKKRRCRSRKVRRMRSCSRPSLTRSRVHAFASDLFLTTPAVASTRGLVEQFRLLCEIDSDLPRLVDHQEAYVPPCSRRLPSCPAGGVGHTQSLIASMIQRQRQIVAVPWRIRPRLRRSIANIRSLPSGSRRALSLQRAAGCHREGRCDADLSSCGVPYALFQAGR